MNIPVNFLIRPGTSRRGAAAGIYSTITACRITSRCAAHRRLGARPLWITYMSRSLTERSANAAKLEAPLPHSSLQHFSGWSMPATSTRKVTGNLSMRATSTRGRMAGVGRAVERRP